MAVETRNLKGMYFQLVETKCFQPRVNLMSVDPLCLTLVVFLPGCRGRRLMFETNGLKGMYFQGVETKRFQHGGSS